MTAEAIIALLLGLLDRASSIGSLLNVLQTENRNSTAEEWQAILDADDSARQALKAAIAAAKAEEAAAQP
jgi:hypothetical protein